MTQWADYLISKVNYDSEHLISTAIRHKDTPKGISKGKPIDRLTMASDIKNGLLYITIYSGKDSWKKGSKIQTFSLSGNPYLRIDNNKVSLDFLGDLPEILASNFYSSEELESQLPPIVESEEEEATPEQLAQVDDLQKQIQELENTLSSQTFPESISDGGEEATPEQLAQVDDLQKQIQELENTLSVHLVPSKNSVSDEFSKIHVLETEAKQLESVDNEYEILETLEKQNKKLDDLEKKLSDLTKIDKK